MRDTNILKSQDENPEIKRIVAKATESARFKASRLKKLKERNELYLAARRAELGIDADDEIDDEVTREL